ncbi:MAG TPA: hypothetical protein VKA76_05265, partial [Gammaproteobacteria bacterium]|nr:hypothetical protein [Gammaproteobacteria bacterium]
MDTRLNRISVAVASLLMAGTAGAAVMARPAPGFRGCPVVTDHTLSRMRGGFSVPFGSGNLDIAFSIQRVTYINGQLKTITKLTIPRVGPGLRSGAAVTTFT